VIKFYYCMTNLKEIICIESSVYFHYWFWLQIINQTFCVAYRGTNFRFLGLPITCCPFTEISMSATPFCKNLNLYQPIFSFYTYNKKKIHLYIVIRFFLVCSYISDWRRVLFLACHSTHTHTFPPKTYCFYFLILL
jgi:hypothetical protein